MYILLRAIIRESISLRHHVHFTVNDLEVVNCEYEHTLLSCLVYSNSFAIIKEYMYLNLKSSLPIISYYSNNSNDEIQVVENMPAYGSSHRGTGVRKRKASTSSTSLRATFSQQHIVSSGFMRVNTS